jgi:hypothetical protein
MTLTRTLAAGLLAGAIAMPALAGGPAVPSQTGKAVQGMVIEAQFPARICIAAWQADPTFTREDCANLLAGTRG